MRCTASRTRRSGRSSRRSCTCTCSSAATRTRAAGSSRSRCRSRSTTSMASPKLSRSSTQPRACSQRTVRHELRTPLAAVRAYAELFGRGAAEHPDDLERSMKGISRESERMSVLVEDLLLLARLDEGRPLEREPVRLDEVAGEAVDAARAVDPGRPIDTDLDAAFV